MTIVELGDRSPRRAGYDLTGVLARLIATAFDPMSVVRWQVPPVTDRATIMPRYFRIVVEHAITHGRVDTVPDHSAVAVWLPAGTPDPPEIRDYHARVADACGRYADRVRTVDEALQANHPATPPHEYLALLAVDPRRQSTGVGGWLLASRHRELDVAGRPAFLHASTPRAARLYERHGYQHRGEPFSPSGCTASFWPMWRDPHPATTPPAAPPAVRRG